MADECRAVRSSAVVVRRTPIRVDAVPGNGPSIDLFGPILGRRMLEIGCGDGRNASILARSGALVHGIDVASTHVEAARRQYLGQSRLTFSTTSAEEYLSTTRSLYEDVYSVFGAVSFVEPRILLALIRPRLAPGGRLWFSVRHLDWDGSGRSQSRRVAEHELSTGAVVRRFDLGRAAWSAELGRSGYTIDEMTESRRLYQPVSQRTDSFIPAVSSCVATALRNRGSTGPVARRSREPVRSLLRTSTVAIFPGTRLTRGASVSGRPGGVLGALSFELPGIIEQTAWVGPGRLAVESSADPGSTWGVELTIRRQAARGGQEERVQRRVDHGSRRSGRRP